MSEIKNTLDGVTNRLYITEKKISKLELSRRNYGTQRGKNALKV